MSCAEVFALGASGTIRSQRSRAPYRIVEHFVSEVGAERVLFGTDAPWMSIQQQLGRVLFADIPDAAKRQILVGNAQQLLGLG